MFGQRYDSAGQAVGTEFQVNSYTTTNSLRRWRPARTAFVVVWESDFQDGPDGVFGQRYDGAGADGRH